ncbi:MAG: histidine kinase, partial [Acidobacteria bacterium]|nr:histidine kinase [Acidobacteriota bacterium]
MKEWSIATRLFAGHLLFMLLLTSVLSVVFFLDSRDRLYAQAADRMTAVARTVADNPLVLAAAKEPNPSAVLQPYAVKVMADAPADFVTIMAPDRTRWTHKFTDEI